MAIRGRKIVKNGENGSEITKAHAWTRYKPNIFSLTAPVLALHIRLGPEGISKEGRDVGAKKLTVTGGRRGRFSRYWQHIHSLRYLFERLTARRLQRKSELSFIYPKRLACILSTRSDRRWSRKGGPKGSEQNALPPPTSRITIHKAICVLFA